METKGRSRPLLSPSQVIPLVSEPLQEERYRYSPLNEELHEIRLLHLLPGLSSEPIHVVLETVPFTSDNVLDFEALSYCWGSEENPIDIFVGKSDKFTLAVTRNLGEALPYLRYEDAPRILWIDAICVNQKDLDERSQQVQRMADIYSKAARVLIWLGPESDDSDLAIDCIEEVSSHIEVDWPLYTMRSTTDATDWADMHIPAPFEDDEFIAISNFFGRSWFKRLWIWQEVLLSSHDPVVICGDRSLAWMTIREVAFCLVQKLSPSHISHDVNAVFYGNLNGAYEISCAGTNQRFEQLIEDTRHCKCSDPRDKVFALLSLVRPHWNMNMLELSYTKDVFEVYQDAMLFWSRKTSRLSLLCTVEMHEDLEGVPSWVPNWSVKRATRPLLSGGFAGGLSAATIPHDVGKILPLTGVIVGKIGAIEKFDFPDADTHQSEATAKEMCQVVSRLGIAGPFIQGSKLVRDLCVVLIGTDFAETNYPPDYNCPTLEAAERALCHVLNYEYASTGSMGSLDGASNFSERTPTCIGRTRLEIPEIASLNVPDGFESQLSTELPEANAFNVDVPLDSEILNSGNEDQICGGTMDEFNLDGLPIGERITFGFVYKSGIHRSLFKSSEGYLGLGPAGTQPGDIIVVLLGCPSAMILRPVQNDKYQVVGEALCQGYLYGEGLLGPLPDSVEPILYSSEASGCSERSFMNRESKEFFPEDRRLSELPLPPEWSRMEHEDAAFFTDFVHRETGEVLYGIDPRITPEMLKERRVDLKVFELV
ncbi:uncharacterized protein PAC_08103 [Phialocephala subalpina]|uniref:Heterokaryon incompatibility domain-containing protein n=1 Tax=Phialocephala subalpina TaxID=576137 RepID=A0A1L7WZL7_9HELO|nr:uncharacterized protein PAC_08103 [Phialocephala subalpina]